MPSAPREPNSSPGMRQATFAEKQSSSPGAEHGGFFLEEPAELAAQWKVLTHVATGVAILTAPAFFLLLDRFGGMRRSVAIVLTVVAVLALRGLMEAVARRLIPSPTLFNTDDPRRLLDDRTAKRRAWFWRSRWAVATWLAVLAALCVLAIRAVMWMRNSGDWGDAVTAIPDLLRDNPGALGQAAAFAVYIPALIIVNALIFLGPLMIAGIRQIHISEPGDADWGVRLDDVRGQARPKEAIRQIVSLWQSGEAFERAGGKRERGVLFLGPPGTGKTMMAKGIASSFNAPFISVAGTGFANAFIGVDILMVNYLAWRARRLARKWGGQCLIFIDEIDAIGLRRSGVAHSTPIRSAHDVAFHGPLGTLTSSGDLLLETEAWRERLFTHRAAKPISDPTRIRRLSDHLRSFVFPGIHGGHASASTMQQLLVLMDGVTEPRLVPKVLRSRANAWLDAAFIIPRQVGHLRLRLRPAKPRGEQLYFIGACNVAFEYLDPALTRPGRMGRQVYFRTPGAADRKDIFDLYLGKVAHESDLDRTARREELSRITQGHSPAMIEQVCSLALTIAHHDGRPRCSWDDLVQAITIVETGIDRGLTFVPSEERATAIHEAGHAVTGHLVMSGHASTRLSILARGRSLGHHHMTEVEERYGNWRHENLANMVWTLGAMAAELVFYGESTTGVSSDVDYATSKAALMTGYWGMPPRVPELIDPTKSDAQRAAEQRRLMKRFEMLGVSLMHRSTSAMDDDRVAAILNDDAKRAMTAQLLGQAFMIAYAIILHNRDKTQSIAETLLERKELYGDEVVTLLNRQHLELPVPIDPSDERLWPKI